MITFRTHSAMIVNDIRKIVIIPTSNTKNDHTHAANRSIVIDRRVSIHRIVYDRVLR